LLGRRPLFTLEGITYSWSDALAWADARGALAGMFHRSWVGYELLRHAEEIEAKPAPDAVGSAATAFRYDHALLSAEQLAEWLTRWNLTVAEWGGYLERTLLLDRVGPDKADADAGPCPDEAELADVYYIDSVCSRVLECEALAFAAEIALADLTPVEAAGDQRAMIERARLASDAARREAASTLEVDREIARRGFDWTRLELDVLELGERAAAREAALCIRIDGTNIAEVGAACRATVERTSVYIGDLDFSLQPSLLAAHPGELVGPIRNEDSFVLFGVRERTPATPADPELRRRAEEVLIERAVKRATDGRVRWHEHF
jgi:hypothetical protein